MRAVAAALGCAVLAVAGVAALAGPQATVIRTQPGPEAAAPTAGAIVYTVAGAESQVARLPLRDTGVATSVRPARNSTLGCGAALPDGVIALCGETLLRLGTDGRVAPWRLHRSDGTPVKRFSPYRLAAAADGSLLALLESGALFRIAPDGTREPMRAARGYGEDVDALPDGSALVVLGEESRVIRVGRDGSVAVVAGNGRASSSGDGGPAVEAGLRLPRAVAALPDGGFLIGEALGVVRRVTPDGRIATVAGGGRGWQDGAPATRVRLGTVVSVDAVAGGDILVAGRRGLLHVRPDGTIWTLLADRADPTTDGLPADRASVAGAVDVAAQADGSVLVIDGRGTSRVALVAAPSTQRLTVALPPSNRVSLRRGRLTVALTREAVARVTVWRDGRAVTRSRRRRLPAGRSTLRLRVPRSDAAHFAAVTARGADGALATHRLAFVPSARLGATVVRRVMRQVASERSGDGLGVRFRCRRRAARRFACTVFEVGDGVFERLPRPEIVRLRPDGLVAVGRDLYEPR